ncbi:hypothetical protein P175DRAFT_0530874 [Aspergillus ochraceoroseus IBT 24754]|uniref:Uncharacterized protein n=1 Tax=Aspergillus ochraceoroseus IBT 24754 TaxID=1392256 RepID=A0A2T5LYL4_9EURO|nr:uncharacterized protein P175DRAFT_0530874 [Aspergillus ochraceoroseus IBT 24754]PTU21378.1 hypothetical protein P175DRAFT_0530874 [Aspergillus ochraceoroseus IBT 24754]
MAAADLLRCFRVAENFPVTFLNSQDSETVPLSPGLNSGGWGGFNADLGKKRGPKGAKICTSIISRRRSTPETESCGDRQNNRLGEKTGFERLALEVGAVPGLQEYYSVPPVRYEAEAGTMWDALEENKGSSIRLDWTEHIDSPGAYGSPSPSLNQANLLLPEGKSLLSNGVTTILSFAVGSGESHRLIRNLPSINSKKLSE